MHQSLTQQFTQTSLLEWLAFAFGVLQVVLALYNKTINFYAGLISVILYTWVFYHAGLFAESLLNAYYIVISIAGIIVWSQRNKKYELAISRTGHQTKIYSTLLFIASFGLLFWVLKTYTSSTVPMQDSLVTALAWVGSYLMVQRKIENWVILNISNIIAIPLQYSKGLELTALLTVIYFIVAVLGYLRWRKILMAKALS
ncbi:MAG: nicotinamide mononucleotide transporter [Chitinophagaceae bacterium]|nr:nicotinamide mononucleotide transporter [Chitinophagaceae bacterium]